jgi:ubiquinone/menaquinone biosynthesis C-methylase UbiE
MTGAGAKSIHSKYGLGYSQEEQDRLRAQSTRLRSLSQGFLRDAGVRPGMRVLELGSGLGDLTGLIAEIIGPTGEIVSLDRSPVMLAQALKSLSEDGITCARFIECDLNDFCLDFDRAFDAVVGRLILTHLDDPVGTLRLILRHVRTGGLVAFQEADSTLCEHLLRLNRDKLPLTYEVCEWIKRARNGASSDPEMGLHLYRVFTLAGLPAPTIFFHTEVYGGACAARIQSTVAMVRNLLPCLENLGINAEAIGVSTLEDRLTSELTAADAVQARVSIASAWAIKNCPPGCRS